MNGWQSLFRSFGQRLWNYGSGPPPVRDATPEVPGRIESTTGHLKAPGAHPGDAILLEAKSLIERSVKKHIKLHEWEFIELLKNKKVSDDTLYEIKTSLFLDRDYNFSDFTGNLYINGGATLAQCPQLSDLSCNMVVAGNFWAKSCDLLSNISGKITVGKNITISHCYNLRNLSGNISSGGRLDIFNCPSLRSLSGTILPGGDLYFSDCPALTTLPDWVNTLGPTLSGKSRKVYFIKSGLSERLDWAFCNEELPGMRIFVSRWSALEAQQLLFDNFQMAFAFWQELAASNAETPALSLPPHQSRELVIFLEELTTTADYINLVSRPALAQRIIHTLLSVLGNERIQEMALVLIHDAISSCGDRVILALDDLETLELYDRATTIAVKHEDPTELIVLAQKMMCIQELRRIARKHVAKHQLALAVEVTLAYQVEIRKHLELPSATEHMIRRSWARVSQQDIDEALVQLNSNCGEEALQEFLKVWEPWQIYQRHLTIPPFAGLPLCTAGHIRECLIDREIKDEMVMLNNTHMTYQALCRAYELTGKNPLTNTPLDWQTVVRLT